MKTSKPIIKENIVSLLKSVGPMTSGAMMAILETRGIFITHRLCTYFLMDLSVSGFVSIRPPKERARQRGANTYFYERDYPNKSERTK